MTSSAVDLPLSLVRAAASGRTGPVLASTPLGTVDAAAVADADPAGWVQPRGADWSLDWWVGAEDRWHHPAHEAAVRQGALGGAPVLETAMRVPGGDVVHRAYGVRASSPRPDGGTWEDSGVVVELENLSSVPVALALVVRPLTLSGRGTVRSVRVDGPVVRVDDRVALVLSRPVARVVHGRPGQVAQSLADGSDHDPGEPIPADADGRLEVALVVPLPHTATVRALLPRVEHRPRRRWFFPSAAPAGEPGAEFDAPSAEAIGKGWAAHSDGVARVELAEPLLDPLVGAAARSLVLGAGDHVLDRADRAVAVTELLARVGVREPLGPVARALVDAQRLNGALTLDDGGDATAALLFAAAPLLDGAAHLLASGSDRWEEDLIGPVAKSIHLVRKGAALADPSTWRAGARALAMVVPALVAVGQPEVAEDAAAAAASVRARLDGAVSEPAASADATAPVDGDLLTRLAAVRERLVRGDAQAVAELLELARLGEVTALGDRYDEAGVPVGVLGYDPGALAARAAAALDLAVTDGAEGPVVIPAWPTEWWGRNVEAHGVRTPWGLTSFALRWHGDRPAILWEIEPPAGLAESAAAPVLTCPGLDPAWRAQAWSGEALMAQVPAPAGLVDAEPSAPTPSISPVRIDLPSAPEEGQSFL